MPPPLLLLLLADGIEDGFIVSAYAMLATVHTLHQSMVAFFTVFRLITAIAVRLLHSSFLRTQVAHFLGALSVANS